MDIETIAAAAVAKPVAEQVIGVVLRRLFSAVKFASDGARDLISSRMSDYLTRQYERCSHISTIVFTAKRPIRDIYIPLTVEKDELNGEGVKYKMNRYNLEFIHDTKKVLLVDGAGMGKSTLIKYLMTEAIDNAITVPVLLELRNIASDKSILDTIIIELNKYGLDENKFSIDKEFVVKNLEKGEFTFFFDGYDEIDPKYKESVTIGVKKFMEAFPRNRYLITSRPDHSLPAFASFQKFSIKSLDLIDAYELIKKYDNYGERSSKLIEELEKRNSAVGEVKDYLKNPLLTTLLYRAYEHKNQIPLKKHLFYRQVYDALYESHDLSCSRQIIYYKETPIFKIFLKVCNG